jgi:hypothetical protein
MMVAFPETLGTGMNPNGVMPSRIAMAANTPVMTIFLVSNDKVLFTVVSFMV